MTTDQAVPRDVPGVVALLSHGLSSKRLLGVELEMSLLRVSDLEPARYEGEAGVASLLDRLIREQGFQPIREGEHVIALERADGTAVTLEPGGQFEIATTPWTTLVELEAGMRETLEPIARAALAEGLWLLGGSLVLAPQDAMPWMPKARYALMRSHFASLGDAGRHAYVMMQRTLSTQVSLDFRDEHCAAELLRLGFLLAPIATALFANSPLNGLEESGFLSFRAEAWRFTDPARCGDVRACFEPGATFDRWVDFVLDAPMMFRVTETGYVKPSASSFREVLQEGRWSDGSALTVPDIINQISGTFPNVRAKRGMVELRSTDGQSFDDLGTIACFWTGLLYDPESRAAVLDLLGGISWEEQLALQAEVPRLGLKARWGKRPLLDVARRVVALARFGLERFEPEALPLLAAVERRVAAGLTPAEELLEAWNGDLGRDPRKLAERLRYPV